MEITRYYKQQKIKQPPTSWTSIVAGNSIDVHLDAWKNRCQDIHGLHTGNKEYSSNKDDLLVTVKVYYEQSYLLSFQEKKWFGRDIELFIQMNEQSIRSWIKMSKKLISQSKRKQLKDKQHPITKYFHHLTSIIQPLSLPLQDAPDKENNRISTEDSALQLTTNERGISPVLNNKQQHINKSLTVTNYTPAQPNIIHPPRRT